MLDVVELASAWIVLSRQWIVPPEIEAPVRLKIEPAATDDVEGFDSGPGIGAETAERGSGDGEGRAGIDRDGATNCGD